jgi:hypothetical protein
MTYKTKRPVTKIVNGNIHRYVEKDAPNARKRITNTKNHRDFAVRQRTTKNGRKGQIKGLYSISKSRPQ